MSTLWGRIAFCIGFVCLALIVLLITVHDQHLVPLASGSGELPVKSARGFADDFSRSPGHGLGNWDTVSGEWSIEFTFDPNGSYGRVYRQQGSDLAFGAGILGWPLTDERFPHTLDLAPTCGVEIRFRTEALPEADHPNTVRIRLTGQRGRQLSLVGRSIGGGCVELTIPKRQ